MKNNNMLDTLNEFTNVRKKYEHNLEKNKEVVSLVNSLTNDFSVDKEKSPIKKFIKSFLPKKENNFDPEVVKEKVNRLSKTVFEQKQTIEMEIQDINNIIEKVETENNRQKNELEKLHNDFNETNEEVLFYIEKENNIVMIMFDYNEYSDEIMNDFLFTTKLPFSIQTRKDILELLSKKVNYVLTFEKIPSDTKGFIGNEYYVQSGIQISNDYVVLLLKDLG